MEKLKAKVKCLPLTSSPQHEGGHVTTVRGAPEVRARGPGFQEQHALTHSETTLLLGLHEHPRGRKAAGFYPRGTPDAWGLPVLEPSGPSRPAGLFLSASAGISALCCESFPGPCLAGGGWTLSPGGKQEAWRWPPEPTPGSDPVSYRRQRLVMSGTLKSVSPAPSHLA